MSNNRIKPFLNQEPSDDQRMTVNKLVELIGEHAKFLIDIEDIQELRELADGIYLTREETDELDRSSLIREIIRQDFLLFNDFELPHDLR